MSEIGPDPRTRLDAILASWLPQNVWDQVNEIVDDIEERKWHDGWDAGAAAYQHDGACG